MAANVNEGTITSAAWGNPIAASERINPDVQFDTATAWVTLQKRHISSSKHATTLPTVTLPESYDSWTAFHTSSIAGRVGLIIGRGCEKSFMILCVPYFVEETASPTVLYRCAIT